MMSMGKRTRKERIGSVWRKVLRPAVMYRERVISTSCFAWFIVQTQQGNEGVQRSGCSGIFNALAG
jgi:hypothetical protein